MLKPEIKERHEFRSGFTAHINKDICEECGEYISVCRFDGINKEFKVDPISCEGCSICSRVCPVGAIFMEENVSGEWYVSEMKYGPFVHAKLGIAKENSGRLVAKVRQIAKEIAEREGKDYVIVDCPPGIGCSVIAVLSGVDLALFVTEPTLSGRNPSCRI